MAIVLPVSELIIRENYHIDQDESKKEEAIHKISKKCTLYKLPDFYLH